MPFICSMVFTVYVISTWIGSSSRIDARAPLMNIRGVAGTAVFFFLSCVVFAIYTEKTHAPALDTRDFASLMSLSTGAIFCLPGSDDANVECPKPGRPRQEIADTVLRRHAS